MPIIHAKLFGGYFGCTTVTIELLDDKKEWKRLPRYSIDNPFFAQESRVVSQSEKNMEKITV